jgi:hypothetical protein
MIDILRLLKLAMSGQNFGNEQRDRIEDKRSKDENA